VPIHQRGVLFTSPKVNEDLTWKRDMALRVA